MKPYSSPKDYLDAARDPSASADELHVLAACEYDFVLSAVAAHGNAEPRTLERLLPAAPRTWNEQELLANIAAHANASAELLHEVARRVIPLLDHGRGHDKGWQAGLNLCINVRTPIAAIELVLRDPATSTAFRKKLAGSTSRKDVLALLGDDRSEAVRSRARRRLEELNGPA